jgi:hypothetical protein
MQMRFLCGLLAVAVGALALGVSVASAQTVGKVTSTTGTVLVMRGNSIHQIAAGDPILKGDRVLSRTGSNATFSGGFVLGPDMSAMVSSNLAFDIYTPTNGSKGGDKDHAYRLSLFKHGGDRDSANVRDDNRSSDGRPAHHSDKIWHGTPRDPLPVGH